MTAIPEIINALELSLQLDRMIDMHEWFKLSHFFDRDDSITYVCEVKHYHDDKLYRGLGKTPLDAMRDAR